jgi:hypothetical protein
MALSYNGPQQYGFEIDGMSFQDLTKLMTIATPSSLSLSGRPSKQRRGPPTASAAAKHAAPRVATMGDGTASGQRCPPLCGGHLLKWLGDRMTRGLGR